MYWHKGEKKSYLAIPAQVKLPSGKILNDEETSRVGLWGMFNDFFSAKALLRINANLLHETQSDYLSLDKLIDVAKKQFMKIVSISLKDSQMI